MAVHLALCVSLVLLFSISALTVAPALAAVGPEGEWLPTGPPATPAGTFGTLLTLQDGTARLIGKPVQRYVPDTGAWQPAGSLTGNGGLPTLLASGKVLVSGLS